MNDSTAIDSQILIQCSHSAEDDSDYFASLSPKPDYYICRDGSVYRGEPSASTVRIMLANLGPLKLRGIKAYPYLLDAHCMPIADISKPPVKYFYEFCEFRKFKGWQYFESYTTAQLASLKQTLISLGAASSDIVLESSISKYEPSPHPQPELINLIKNLNQ